ncbi:MAG: TIGR00730 family Rossman fold protein [Pseudomonadota bacterium]|nr:TIGR00730 family Rossman fold protein [Pseudomonadota bacterium]
MNQSHQLSAPALVAVYCGSRLGNHADYQQMAQDLGRALVEANLGLVYGGASIGLMGVVADAVLEQSGTVVGVIPEFMLDYEVAHDRLTELHVVESMHVRKALMAARASAFVAIAGGIGTLEELTEIMTWRQLGQHHKPILLLNHRGFFDGLLMQFERSVADGFLQAKDAQRVQVCDSIEQVMAGLRHLSPQQQPVEVNDF